MLNPYEAELIRLRQEVADLKYILAERDRVECAVAAALIDRWKLAPTEGEFLAILYGAKGKVVSKETLLTRIYGYDTDIGEKIIDVWLCKLRKKLGPDGIEIETKWGRGMRMPPASCARVAAIVNEPKHPAAELVPLMRPCTCARAS
jgi:two-component system cell cycle response regulator CtrA